MSQLNLIRIKSVLQPGVHTREQLKFKVGQSIAELIPEPIGTKLPWAITLNGKVIDPDHRGATFPANGDYVTVCPVPAGGDDDGKTIVRIVAIIAVMYITQGAVGAEWASSLMTTTGFGTVAGWQAAMAIGGSMLVNALLPPTVNQRNKAESPTYGIDGAKNTSAEGVPVPICYGQFRMAGNIISNYVINDGNTQILYMLINAGEGPVAALTKPQINEQPIENYVDWEVLSPPRLGTPDQEPVDWFASAIVPEHVGQEFLTAWKTVTIGSPGSDVYDRVRFDLIAPGGLVEMIEGGESVHGVSVTLEFQYRPAGSTGAWSPLTFGNETTGQVETDYFTPPFDPDEYSGEIFCDEDNVLYIIQTHSTESGDFEVRTNVGVRYPAGQHDTSGVIQINASQRNPYRKSLLSFPLAQGAYEFRYRRTTEPAPNTQTAKTDNIFLGDINKMINEKVAYRDTALFGLKVRLNDQLNGLPNVTYINGGKLIWTYNVTTKEWEFRASSNPAWICWDILTNQDYGGGAATSRLDFYKWVDWATWCDLEGLEFHGVIDTAMNVWDAMNLVSRAGRGQVMQIGTRYSVVVEREDVPTQMFSVANMISGTFKESWTGMADRANEIEAVYCDRNDNYKERTVRLYDRNAIAAGLPQRVARVETRGIVTPERAFRELKLMLNMNRWIQRSVEFGAPLDAIACRPGDLIIVQHDMPSWGAAGRCERDSTTSLIKLDSPVKMVGDKTYKALLHFNSRSVLTTTVHSVAGDNVILASTADLPTLNPKRALIAGTDHEIRAFVTSGSNVGIVVPSTFGITAGMAVELVDTNVLVSQNVVNPYATGEEGEVTEITLASPLLGAPALYDKWLFGETNKVAKQFRVTRITGSHDYRRDIAAIEYYPQIYDDEILDGPPPNYSDLDPRLVQHVTIDNVSEMARMVGRVFLNEVIVAFHSDQQTYKDAYVYVSRNGSPFKIEGIGRNSVGVPGQKGEELVFKVVARDTRGSTAPYPTAPEMEYTVTGAVIVPPDVTGLSWAIKPGQVVVKWDKIETLVRLETELRVGATWGTAEFLWVGGSTDYKHARPPNGTYKVWAAHRSTTGHYSANPVSVDVTVDDSIDGGGGGTLRLTTDRFPFFGFSNGTTHTPVAPGDGLLTILAKLQGISGVATWVAEAFDSRVGGSSLGTFELGGSGNVRTMDAAQFVSQGVSGAVRRVRVTASLGTAEDFIDIFRQDSTTTEPILYLSNPVHAVPTDETGEYGDYSGAWTEAVVYVGMDNKTNEVDWAIVPDANVDANINGGPGPVSAPAVVIVSVTDMTVPTGSVLISATDGVDTLSASFTVDKREANGSGYVASWTPRSEIVLPVSSTGEVLSYDEAWADLVITKGGMLNDVENWTLTKQDVNTISTLDGARVNVTGLAAMGELGTLVLNPIPYLAAGWTYPQVIVDAGDYWIVPGYNAYGDWSKIARSPKGDFANWEVVDHGLMGRFALAAAAQGGIVMVETGVGSTNKTRRSTNNGATWSGSVSLPTSSQWYDLRSNDSVIMLSSQVSTTGAYSVDGGASWSSRTYPASSMVFFVGPGSVWVSRDSMGVDRISTNNGATWSTTTTGLPGTIWDCKPFAGRMVASLWGDSNKVAVWEPATGWTLSTLPHTVRRGVFAIVRGVLYLVGQLFSPIMYSTDGKTWKAGPSASPADGWMVVHHKSLPLGFIPDGYGNNARKMPLLATSEASGSVVIEATKPDALPIKISLPVRKAEAQRPVYAFAAFPASLGLPATADGVVTDFSNATITAQAWMNAVNDPSWTWTWTAINMTPSSGSSAVATFTGMSPSHDTGYVTFVGSKAGEQEIRGTLNVWKMKGTQNAGPIMGGAFHTVGIEGQTYIALKFMGNGMVQVKHGVAGAWQNLVPWALPLRSENSALFLRLDATGHPLDSGTTGSYLALTTDRIFVLTDDDPGIHRTDFEVRLATDALGTNAITGSGSMKLELPTP